MDEAGKFTAIRLALASTEQVKSWSHGEVIRPETINYRTLRPEKDGLFCEKIFGPVKDFDCGCGKYKGVRYKGIKCDKCGVEVTRSKVRRERMGHLELAAPVAHIWFSKGVPSRLSLILDIPPKSLDKILYFSHYVVTEINEEAKKQAITLLNQDIEKELKVFSSSDLQLMDIRKNALEDELSIEINNLSQNVDELEKQKNDQVNELIANAQEQEEYLKNNMDGKLKKQLKVGKTVLGKRGDIIVLKLIEKLTKATEKNVDTTEKNINKSILKLQKASEKAQIKLTNAANKELLPVKKRVEKSRDHLSEEYSRYQKWLEDLEDPVVADKLMILSEPEYREYEEKFGLVFKAEMGAEAVKSILARINLDELSLKLASHISHDSFQKQQKSSKRLRLIESMRKSNNKPEWMVMDVLPILPPDLRPMVQLDGGRFATSDLNDLYRRVINRNNRLKRLINLGAPEIIIKNEKRMLQESVDSLIDNGRRGKPISGTGNHKLKSLSDLIKGKQGRFRQNLLGKRVDYSGRSVIIVGPNLRLEQCGIPKKMALELFKPFVMHQLFKLGFAQNIKSAKRIVERGDREVWDVLEEVIKTRPVLLNRAPTLHRLGIQAFEPILVEGNAIQLHPLVCFAYNADFDGDQMAVHVPLSYPAVAEARQIMLSTKNLLAPSDGSPVVAPTLDMVLGCYYMTYLEKDREKQADVNKLPIFSKLDDVITFYELEHLKLHDLVKIRFNSEFIVTTVGRVIFNDIIPDGIEFQNQAMDKKALRDLVFEAYTKFGNELTAKLVDDIKDMGFKYATKSGITISSSDINVPQGKVNLMAEADKKVEEMEEQYQLGLVTDAEKYASAIEIWSKVSDDMGEMLNNSLDPEGPLAMMSHSGAKGNIAQIRQMAGLRGLMSGPTGKIIDLPIRSSFKEGLSVLEYFISTHGARKGLADTALRTADSGYLTRRMIDVAQDIIITLEDCHQESDSKLPGIIKSDTSTNDDGLGAPLKEKIVGRFAAETLMTEDSKEVILEENAEVTLEIANQLESLKITQLKVRSPLTCKTRKGLCQKCYGISLATGKLVELGVAVGIISAQSIGEPGTQLTMRTFHTGGVAGGFDITSGLPRVEEIFEARKPKGLAILAGIDGNIEFTKEDNQRGIKITNTDEFIYEYELSSDYNLKISNNEELISGQTIAELSDVKSSIAKSSKTKAALLGKVEAKYPGNVKIVQEENGSHKVVVFTNKSIEDEYKIPSNARVLFESGSFVQAGSKLTEGAIDPQEILSIRGPEAVQMYLVDEVQSVYKSQGVNINDIHIEVIVRQMMRKVKVQDPGDSNLLPNELSDKWNFEKMNTDIAVAGGKPATAVPVLMGVTKASLSTESFLAAASFQETTRVLTEAAISGAVDPLYGLKENVIIGKLIPAKAEIVVEIPEQVPEMQLPESIVLPFMFEFEKEILDQIHNEEEEERQKEPVASVPERFVAKPEE
jgi:DNA-directed RNA polymerase subunit beta'